MATNDIQGASGLERLQRVAARLRPLRWPLLAVLLLSIGAFAAATIGRAPANWAQPAFIGGIWSLLTLSFVTGFRAVPARIERGLLRRGLRSLHRGAYWLLALLTVVATVATALLTLRLLLYAG